MCDLVVVSNALITTMFPYISTFLITFGMNFYQKGLNE